MKTILLSIMFVVICGFITAAMAIKTDSNQMVKLRINQQKTISAANLTIKFISVVEDSRCPAGVNCIWAGNGKVKIKVTGKNKKSETFELNTNLSPQSVVFQNQEIKLMHLEPNTDKDKSIEPADYSATFALSKPENPS